MKILKNLKINLNKNVAINKKVIFNFLQKYRRRKVGYIMFISIIIPIYNTEKYLDECLQSLLKQNISTDDYEIICINDGSTDASLNLLNKYENETSNLKIINQKNSGVCAARNNGINLAKGDYIWFIDSDDYIEENILTELKKKAYSKDYDRITFENYYFADDEATNKMSKKMAINTRWVDSVVTQSIFKRKFIIKNDLYFHYPELTYGEDSLYIYEVKRAVPYTLHLKKPIYYARGRRLSASSEENTPEGKRNKLISNLRESQIMQKYYESGDQSQMTADRFMSFLWGTMFQIANLSQKDAAIYLKQLKDCGLYPYRKPMNCKIIKSSKINRDDIVGRSFDKIYTNLHTKYGYHLMRCWLAFFRFKRHLKGKRDDNV